MDARIEAALEGIFAELRAILKEIQDYKAENPTTVEVTGLDERVFFSSIKPGLFTRLTQSQVDGIKAKLKAFKNAGFPVSWAAYGLATSYHETAKRMMPVREGLNVSDAYRKKHFRYYPWYGRGDVQLTWRDNYVRADKELGLNGRLVENADLALDPDISAQILVRGMLEGWFSGDAKGRHTLKRHLPKDVGSLAQFKQARRIVNLMDKADLIAGYAMQFQTALQKANY